MYNLVNLREKYLLIFSCLSLIFKFAFLCCHILWQYQSKPSPAVSHQVSIKDFFFPPLSCKGAFVARQLRHHIVCSRIQLVGLATRTSTTTTVECRRWDHFKSRTKVGESRHGKWTESVFLEQEGNQGL